MWYRMSLSNHSSPASWRRLGILLRLPFVCRRSRRRGPWAWSSSRPSRCCWRSCWRCTRTSCRWTACRRPVGRRASAPFFSAWPGGRSVAPILRFPWLVLDWSPPLLALPSWFWIWWLESLSSIYGKKHTHKSQRKELSRGSRVCLQLVMGSTQWTK